MLGEDVNATDGFVELNNLLSCSKSLHLDMDEKTGKSFS